MTGVLEPPGFSMRAMVQGDAVALALLHRMAFADPWASQAFRSLLTNEACFGMIAVDAQEKLCAMVLLQHAVDQCEILTIATAPSMRRQGLAAAVLRAGAASALARGAREIFLEVAAGNEAALGLYRGLGFQPGGRRRGYYRHLSGDREDALVLRAPLPLP